MSSDPSETAALSGLETVRLKRHGHRQASRRRERCRPTFGCLMITVTFTLLGTAVIILSCHHKHLKILIKNCLHLF